MQAAREKFRLQLNTAVHGYFYNGHTEEVFELGSATRFREIETDVARSTIITGLWAFFPGRFFFQEVSKKFKASRYHQKSSDEN